MIKYLKKTHYCKIIKYINSRDKKWKNFVLLSKNCLKNNKHFDICVIKKNAQVIMQAQQPLKMITAER